MDTEKNDDVKLIEKALKAGLGIISLGEEKLGKLADELARRGEEFANQDESPISRLVSAFSETGNAIKHKGTELSEAIKETGGAIKHKGIEMGKAIKKTSTGLKDKVEEEVKDVFQKVNFATKADLEKLRAEVEQLKEKIAKKKPAKKRRATKK